MRKKKLYKKIFRLLRDILTLRPIRKYIKYSINFSKDKRIVKDIELKHNDRIVLIFQHQMYDRLGKNCYNGGAERYVTDLADIITDCGYEPVLIQMGDRKIGFWERKVKNLRILGLPVYDYEKAIGIFKKYKFVVYSGAVDWGKKLHPNILISHGITWDTYTSNVEVKKILKFFQGVDKFVSVDTNTISWLRTTFSQTLKDLDVNYVPNYVDTSLYKPKNLSSDRDIRITFPRRLSPERGYWLVSEALPAIMEKYPNITFNFVGYAHNNEIIKDVQNLIKRFPQRISHYTVTPDEMPEIYQKTDISLIPTLYAEGTSLSCLEAQACGNVVISTNIGGLPNLIIDRYNGLLINPKGQDLKYALDMVLADKKLRYKLSNNAVNVSHVFDKKIWVERWRNVIENIVTRR